MDITDEFWLSKGFQAVLQSDRQELGRGEGGRGRGEEDWASEARAIVAGHSQAQVQSVWGWAVRGCRRSPVVEDTAGGRRGEHQEGRRGEQQLEDTAHRVACEQPNRTLCPQMTHKRWLLRRP